MLPSLSTPVPGPESRRLAGELAEVESPNVTYRSNDFPIFWERASGVNVWDVDNNRFLDLTSGFGVAGLGFTPEPIVAALREQSKRLYHAMGDVHPTAEKVALCQRLSQLTFGAWQLGAGKAILTNSGGEAVEAALKTAWLATRRRGVLAFSGSYHGLGYGALTVTGRELFRAPFAPQLADFATFLQFPAEFDLVDEPAWAAAAEALLSRCEIGAILVEPIQARGGEVVPQPWLLPRLRTLADRFGAVLIADEIFTGFYRTGPRFGCDHWGVRPDLICLGKALTSGFPLAACVGRAELMDRAWPRSTGEALYTSTFLGNPLGCRMALTSLDLLEAEPWSQRVEQTGQELARLLGEMAGRQTGWGPVRGRGLLRGIALCDPAGAPAAATAGRLVEKLLGRGLIVLAGGTEQNVLSLTPPFIITAAELAFAVEQIEAARAELS